MMYATLHWDIVLEEVVIAIPKGVDLIAAQSWPLEVDTANPLLIVMAKLVSSPHQGER